MVLGIGLNVWVVAELAASRGEDVIDDSRVGAGLEELVEISLLDEELAAELGAVGKLCSPQASSAAR